MNHGKIAQSIVLVPIAGGTFAAHETPGVSPTPRAIVHLESRRNLAEGYLFESSVRY